MSNRFVGWVKQKMILDGWISPEEHKKLLARIKELEQDQQKHHALIKACLLEEERLSKMQ